MKQFHWEDAFTPVPPTVHARVEQSLREVRAMSVKHKKPVLALALAVILVLAAACVAVAATQGGVLDYLFGGWQETPTAQQQQMVQGIGQTWRTDGATVTATDALFDGRRLDVGLSYTVERDTFVMLEGAWFNGELATDAAAGQMNRWVSPQAEPVTDGISVSSDVRLTGPVEVRLRLMLLTPNKGLRQLDFGRMADDAACDAAFYDAVAEGYTPVDAQSRQIYLPMDARQRQAALQKDEAYPGFRHSLAWAAEANMTAREVNLVFTVASNAEASGEVTRLYYREAEGAPWDIVVETAELTPTASHFVIDVYPKEGGMDWEQMRAFFLSHTYGFYGEDRQKVAFQLAGSHYGQGDPCQAPDGRSYWRIDQEEPAAIGDISVLYLVPETPEGEAEWEYAIRLEAIPAEDLNG